MQKEKVKVIVARPGEKAYVTEIVPDYKTLSNLVGGHIEITYPIDDDVAIICDECGKLKGKMPNRTMYGAATPDNPIYKDVRPDVYAGTIIIIGTHDEESGEFDSLKKHEIELYMNLYEKPQFLTDWCLGVAK